MCSNVRVLLGISDRQRAEPDCHVHLNSTAGSAAGELKLHAQMLGTSCVHAAGAAAPVQTYTPEEVWDKARSPGRVVLNRLLFTSAAQHICLWYCRIEKKQSNKH